MDSRKASRDFDFIRNSLVTIRRKSNDIYKYLSRLPNSIRSDRNQLLQNTNTYFKNEKSRMNSIQDAYSKFEKDFDIICDTYLQSMNQLYNEVSKEFESFDFLFIKQKLANIANDYKMIKEKGFEMIKDSYSKFNSSIENIINEYKKTMNELEKESKIEHDNLKENIKSIQKNLKQVSEIDITPFSKGLKCVYKDGYVSENIDIDLLSQYPGCYLYKEYLSSQTNIQELYINRDSKNEELILRYMKNDDELNQTLLEMDSNNRSIFIEDLDYFELPVKSKFMNILCSKEDNLIEDCWDKNRIITINNKNIPYINKELQANNKLDTLLNTKVLKDVHYDNEEKILVINIELDLKYIDLIESYLSNNKEWDSHLLFIQGLDYKDIIDEMQKLELEINDNDIEKLKKAWMSVRRIYINDKYYKSIDEYLHSSSLFFDLYFENIDTEHIENDFLFVSKYVVYGSIIDDYLSNDNKLNEELLRIAKDRSYERFISDINDLDLSLTIEDLNLVAKHFLCPSEVLIGTTIAEIQHDYFFTCWLGSHYRWKCIYRASEHDYTPKSFHKYCDDVGPTLILIKDKNGYIFGGYTTQSWSQYIPNQICKQYWKQDDNAFIFTLKNAHRIGPTRYNVLKGKGGIHCDPKLGPAFGNMNYCFDFCIYDKCNRSLCICGTNGHTGFEWDPVYQMSMFTNSNRRETCNEFLVYDYEVFCHI